MKIIVSNTGPIVHLKEAGLLDLGEAEAILLAKRFNPKWFLTDDTEARIFANS